MQKAYGTAFASASSLSGSSESAWGAGWGKWGRGHRLGGDAEAGMSQQQGRSRGMTILVVVGFVVIACGLGVVFMMHRDPEGWWTTLKEAVLGGDMEGATPIGGPLKNPGAI